MNTRKEAGIEEDKEERRTTLSREKQMVDGVEEVDVGRLVDVVCESCWVAEFTLVSDQPDGAVTPLVQLFSPKLTDKAITRVVTKILSLAIRPKSAHSLSLVLR